MPSYSPLLSQYHTTNGNGGLNTSKKRRSFIKRIVRRYEITPTRLVLFCGLLLLLTFLGYHLINIFRVADEYNDDFTTTGSSDPLRPFIQTNPNAPVIVEGGRVEIIQRPQPQTEDGKERQRQQAKQQQLDQFYRERLRNQEEDTAALLNGATSIPFTPIPPKITEATTTNSTSGALKKLSTATGAQTALSKSTTDKTRDAPDSSKVATDAASPAASVQDIKVEMKKNEDGSTTTKVAISAAAAKEASLSSGTSPKKPLAATVDVSRLYDTEERRNARNQYLSDSAELPLPKEVLSRKVNNVVFDVNHQDKPLNEEWSETIAEKLKHPVKAPGIITSFTSPDGGLELSLFIDLEGRIGYSMTMNSAFSVLAQQMLQDGKIKSLDEVKGNFLLPSLLDLSLDTKLCLFDTKAVPGQAEINFRLTKGFSYWHPVPKAERNEYGESWTQLTLWNGLAKNAKEAAQLSPCGSFMYEFRLFNIGLGVRALVQPLGPATPPSTVLFPNEGEYVPVHWSMGLRLQDGTVDSHCIANNYEEPFVNLACRSMTAAMMTPLTVEMAEKVTGEGLKLNGKHAKGPSHMAFIQAGGPGFVRSTVVAAPLDKSRPFQTQLILVTRGEAPVKPTDPDTLGVLPSPMDPKSLLTPTSWHVLIFGGGLRHLPHASHLAPLLCDPPSHRHPDFVDSRWVPSGKLFRITKFTTSDSKAVVDWTAEHNFPLVHFDAGWYGDEYKKSSSAKQVLASIADQLDMAAVASYANSKNRRVSLYVNELALRDTDELTRIYSDWGVGGVKFGFVEVSDARSMRILHERILAFGKAGLFINVHDSYRPRGLTRTFPFLVAQEGVRGEERKPDALHHTILPYVRLLQGSADYTPRYLNGAGLKCTKAHQLSVPLMIYSPIQSLFWAEPLSAVSQSVQDWNKELAIWTRMPTTWDDTRHLQAVMGEYASIARRDGADWYVATITNTQERKLELDLNPLWHDLLGHPSLGKNVPLQTGYLVHSYKDGPWKARHDPFTVKVQPRTFFWLKPPKEFWPNGKAPQPPVPGLGSIEGGIFKLDLAPSGGHTLYLTPATPEALKAIPGKKS